MILSNEKISDSEKKKKKNTSQTSKMHKNIHVCHYLFLPADSTVLCNSLHASTIHCTVSLNLLHLLEREGDSDAGYWQLRPADVVLWTHSWQNLSIIKRGKKKFHGSIRMTHLVDFDIFYNPRVSFILKYVLPAVWKCNSFLQLPAQHKLAMNLGWCWRPVWEWIWNRSYAMTWLWWCCF